MALSVILQNEVNLQINYIFSSGGGDKNLYSAIEMPNKQICKFF